MEIEKTNWTLIIKNAKNGDETALKVLRYKHYTQAWPNNENARDMLKNALQEYREKFDQQNQGGQQ